MRHLIHEILRDTYFDVIPKVVPMGAIVIRTRLDEGTESAEVATSVISPRQRIQSTIIYIFLVMTCTQNATVCI